MTPIECCHPADNILMDTERFSRRQSTSL